MTGSSVRTTNGRPTKISATRIPERRVGDLDAERRQQRADPALRREQRGQRDAGDRRRQRERHVDQRIRQVAAGKAVADHHPGDQQAERHVDRRRQRRGTEAQPQRRQHAWFGDRVPYAVEAQLPRPQHQRGKRQQYDQRQPGQRDAEGRGEARQGGASRSRVIFLA